MHRFFVFVILTLTTFFAGASHATERFDVEIEVVPAQPSGAYECRAKIVDLHSGEVLAAPRLVFLRGTEASVESQFPVDEGVGLLRLQVEVDEKGESATYASQITVGEKVLQRQKVSFRLSGEAPAMKTPISMSLKDADLIEVLRSFAKMGDFNMVIDPAVSGKVTVELKNVPWDQALEQVLKINGLGMEISESHISIGPR